MTDVEVHSSPSGASKRRSYRPPLRTQGGAWGAERVRLGVAMRDLERSSGVNRWILSLAEQGRLIPTGEEFEAVMGALRAEEARQAGLTEGGSTPG